MPPLFLPSLSLFGLKMESIVSQIFTHTIFLPKALNKIRARKQACFLAEHITMRQIRIFSLRERLLQMLAFASVSEDLTMNGALFICLFPPFCSCCCVFPINQSYLKIPIKIKVFTLIPPLFSSQSLPLELFHLFFLDYMIG